MYLNFDMDDCMDIAGKTRGKTVSAFSNQKRGLNLLKFENGLPLVNSYCNHTQPLQWTRGRERRKTK